MLYTVLAGTGRKTNSCNLTAVKAERRMRWRIAGFASLVCGVFAAGVVASTVTVSNFEPIEIRDYAPAKPYPSTITVSNLDGCTVRKVTITFHGFSHAFPSDVATLLVGPQGQIAIPMAQVGGQIKLSVTNLVLTLDDDAPEPLPVYTNLQSGIFKPTNGYLAFGRPCLPYDFPAPAPAGNSNAPSTLAVFKGTDPNGPWRLFVVDDSGSWAGSISGGWSLHLSVSGPLQVMLAETNVVVSWPTQAQGFVLQVASELAGPNNWSNWAGVPFQTNGWYYVCEPVGPGQRFYRLKK